ncbi:hypothetical protein [Alloscardovia criceti]|uniref:hypothetical protein n=1 Tax=Alloscardovia criceti TaxID=356828 RepID=UPI00035C3A62|nr:hypothetical protein [Alloscardovia criceti]
MSGFFSALHLMLSLVSNRIGSYISTHRNAAFFAVSTAIIILTLELAVFNLGTWMSPSGASAVSCEVATSCSATLSHAQWGTGDSVTDTGTDTDTDTASATETSSTNTEASTDSTDRSNSLLYIQDFDATLSIPVSLDTPITTLSFDPSNAEVKSFSTPITIGSQQITLYSDRSTFVFLDADAQADIAKNNAIVIHFVSGEYTRNPTEDPVQATSNLRQITLNARKPFHISVARMLALLALAAFIWLFRPRSALYRIALDTQSHRQRLVFWLACVLPLVLVGIVAIYFGGLFAANDTWAQDHNYIYSYRHYILASQALLEGHPWLDLPVDPSFDALSNPYDPQLRNTILNQSAQIYWDYAFYQHHWYSYFGILPSIVLYLPFHALTGSWPSVFASVIVFLIPAMILVMASIIRFIARYFPQTSIGHTILVLISAFVGMNFISLLLVSNLYTLAFSSALCVAFLGVFIWLGVRPEKPALSNYLRMGVGSFFIALTTSCRPTFAFTAILVAPVFFEFVWEKPLKQLSRALSAAVVPAILGVLPALWYNWWRFGSALNFGSGYQITVADMRNLRVTTLSTLQGVGAYLFQPFDFTAQPPFIQSPFISTSTWIHRETIISGFFIFAPLIALGILSVLLPQVRKRLHPQFIWLYSLAGVIFGVLLCILVTRSGGIVWRYFVDFTWAFVFAAIAPALSALAVVREKGGTRARQSSRYHLVLWVVVALTVYEMLVFAASIFVPNRFAALSQYNPSLYASFVQALTIM